MYFFAKRSGKRLVTMLFLLSLLAYFIFHAIQGRHGLSARVGFKRQLAKLEVQLSELKARRNMLEHYIGLMKSQTIDPDILDEYARRSLNLANPSDVIIMKIPKDR